MRKNQSTIKTYKEGEREFVVKLHADGKTTLQYINLSLADVAAEYTRAIAVIEQRYGGDS